MLRGAFPVSKERHDGPYIRENRESLVMGCDGTEGDSARQDLRRNYGRGDVEIALSIQRVSGKFVLINACRASHCSFRANRVGVTYPPKNGIKEARETSCCFFFSHPRNHPIYLLP